MNFYKHFLGDYARDTQSLSLTEHGAYRVLLDHCYATEKSLPESRQEIYRIAKAMSAVERKAVDRIVEQFFPNGSNSRCAEEIAKAHAYASAQAERADMRWHKQRQSPADASHSHSHSSSNTTTLAQASRLSLNGTELIPLKDGSAWQMPDDFLAELQRLCPRVDAVLTLREIRVWCLANEERLKTARGVRRFVGGWFAREQAKADGAQA